ncbi:MAG: putative U5 small nuclear ribonucleoprotein 200 kDa helicase [Streblomastix strix]|uniref:Putative U5 small nuclear ribonucleoprotein 200 kDa helicase n=1 Tax=Streblomastix strix TaxID=222440 RepID=A0A5J4VZ17_9EUKA|nr:MAG: putative U5 small nuclear ribonucleoprotein 200 kDa helicase [Streblomastix strix]
MAEQKARERNTYKANIVLNQENKPRVDEPSGEAGPLDTSQLMNMGDLAIRNKPPKSQPTKKKVTNQAPKRQYIPENDDDDQRNSKVEEIAVHFDDSEEEEGGNEYVESIEENQRKKKRSKKTNQNQEQNSFEGDLDRSEDDDSFGLDSYSSDNESEQEQEKEKEENQIKKKKIKMSDEDVEKKEELEESVIGFNSSSSSSSQLKQFGIFEFIENDKEFINVDERCQLVDLESLKPSLGSQALSVSEGFDRKKREMKLPPGTEERKTKGYEEIIIPSPKPVPPPIPLRIIDKDLPKWAQFAFIGTSNLNPIQSVVFDSAFKGSRNLLVCAPTGAGKTNIAMLTILHEIGLHLEKDQIIGEIEKEEENKKDQGSWRKVDVYEEQEEQEQDEDDQVDKKKKKKEKIKEKENKSKKSMDKDEDEDKNPNDVDIEIVSEQKEGITIQDNEMNNLLNNKIGEGEREIQSSNINIQSRIKVNVRNNEYKIVYIAPMKSLVQEMTRAFTKRLAPYGITVKELSGDSQLTRVQLQETQVIVTTPEKWDIVTRKAGDRAVAEKVRLVIIDEIHLLHDNRGPVLESIIARIMRGVESTGEMVRIVGLSATLPNYRDIAELLRVEEEEEDEQIINEKEKDQDEDEEEEKEELKNKLKKLSKQGLFHFPNTFRPIPLRQTYVGITETKGAKKDKLMNDVVYQKLKWNVTESKSAIVFVHSRRDTVLTAKYILNRELGIETGNEMVDRMGKEYEKEKEEEQEKEKEKGFEAFKEASSYGLPLFRQETIESMQLIIEEKNESNEPIIDEQLRELLKYGIGVHHAGMALSDRRLVEELFAQRQIGILISTATLAWGVNLPAHMVVIKGTQVYSPELSSWIEISPMDIMQMMGRAGRPQFDKSGEGVLITSQKEMPYYLFAMNEMLPIESQMISRLTDAINAEVVLGNISSHSDACDWIKYTYLCIRMRERPQLYSIDVAQIAEKLNISTIINQSAQEAQDETLPMILREQAKVRYRSKLLQAVEASVEQRIADLAFTSLIILNEKKLVKFNKKDGSVLPEELGRIASHFYISPDSIAKYSQFIQGEKIKYTSANPSQQSSNIQISGDFSETLDDAGIMRKQ